jgi:hypothetical protein
MFSGNYAVLKSTVANAGLGLFFKGIHHGHQKLDLKPQTYSVIPEHVDGKCMALRLNKNNVIYCEDTSKNIAWFMQGMASSFVMGKDHRKTNLARSTDRRFPYKKQVHPVQKQTHRLDNNGMLVKKEKKVLRAGMELFSALGPSFVNHIRGEISQQEFKITNITSVDKKKGLVFANILHHPGRFHIFKIADVLHLKIYNEFVNKK